MKELGSFVKKYPVKWLLSFIYFLPIILLLIGIILIAISAFKSVPEQRNYYWGIIGVMLVLVLILLGARAAALPKYYFELYEKGLKIQYFKNNKYPNEVYNFGEISEIWLFAINNGKNPNYLAFKLADDSYKIIPPKYSDSKGLIKKMCELYVADVSPIKSMELTQGQRLNFAVLPEDSLLVVNSEKAIIPYLQKSHKEFISLDRFSLFDGKMTYALSDINKAQISPNSGNITITTIDHKELYSRNYLSLCNADLFANLVNEMSTNTQTPSIVSESL